MNCKADTVYGALLLHSTMLIQFNEVLYGLNH